jgi:hypothetical protein
MWKGKDANPALTDCENQASGAIWIMFAVSEYKFPISFWEVLPARARLSPAPCTEHLRQRLEQNQKSIR